MASSGPACVTGRQVTCEAFSKPVPVGVGPLFSFRSLAPGLPAAEPVGGGSFAPAVLRWLRKSALDERERWVLWLPVAFGIGIALYFALPDEPSSLLGAALGGSGLLLALAAAGSEHPGGRAVL